MKNSMRTVSIVVPVYQADDWLPQCLKSIERQTYEAIELIVIDDPQGSGVAAARNRGLEKATGEFIAFCDADDYLEPDAIERMVKAIDGVDMVAGSFRKFGDFQESVEHKTTEMTPPQIAAYVMGNLLRPRHNQMLSGCWAKLYRRSLVAPFPILKTAEDMAFNFEYLRRCKKVRFISDIVYNNRKHPGTLTTTFNESDKTALFGFLEALGYVDRFLAPYIPEAQRAAALDSSKMYHSMLYFMRACQHTGLPMNDVFKRLYP